MTTKTDSMEHHPVQAPKHYRSHPSGVECIQITEHMGFCIGNAVKYLWRADLKGNAIEDLEKAKWYIEREIALRNSVRATERAVEPIGEWAASDGAFDERNASKAPTRAPHGYDWEAMGFDEDTFFHTQFRWDKTPEGTAWWSKAKWDERVERFDHMKHLFWQDVREGRL